MSVTTQDFIKALRKAAIELASHESELSALDSQLGDGDHGAAITAISNIICTQADTSLQDPEKTLDIFLETVSDVILSTGLGSTSSLWGTYFYGLSEGAEGVSIIDATICKRMLQKGFESIAPISKAQLGDKTMMDALIPATEAALAHEGSVADIMLNAANAATQGAEKTKEFVAKFGRAKNFKEQSLGHKDAGATSFSYFLQALAQELS